jgi:hypothetical protein
MVAEVVAAVICGCLRVVGGVYAVHIVPTDVNDVNTCAKMAP